MAKNLALLLTSFLLMLVLGEWLFPKFLEKLPLRLYGSIDKNLRILAQSSKKSLLPNEYIAITGDSYAIGVGDWLAEVRKKSFLGSPDYSPAHMLYKKTGIDVVSFGQGGVGSFRGIWKETITQFLYINSIKDYHLSPPKYLLVFFYEGNDIYNNFALVTEFQSTEKEIEDKTKLARFDDFLNVKHKEVQSGNYERSFWKNMLFTRSILNGISNLVEEWAASNKYQKVYFSYPKTPINVALIDEKKVPLPMHLQAPPVLYLNEFEKKEGLTDKTLEEGVYVFKKSLAQLVAFFPKSEIKIVYIPSPLSSYTIISPIVSYRGWMQINNFIEATVIKKRHMELCKTIQSITLAHNISFINTTKSLKEAGSKEFIHGPIDWDHFNKRGYEALSTDIAEVFLKPRGATRTDNCTY